MHVVFRESHGLEEIATPFDVGQDPADLIVLSFSDSDLGAFAAGWHRAGGKLPSCRLANLVALKHPLSVDTYAEQTLEGAKGVLVRLIGGESYWSYGLATLQDLARRKGIALAILPADGREDPRLDELSTLPVSTLRRLQALCDAGGAVAAQAALAQMALAAGLYAGPVPGLKTMPDHGFYDPDQGVITDPPQEGKPLVLVSFYRSYLTSADTAPVDALIADLRARGYAAYGIFAASLKAPAAADWLAEELLRLAPAGIINATAFSAQGSDGRPSPLSVTGCPVFQVALSTARRKDWADATRGLSPADLAMHVVLPEVDGLIMAGVVSFKAPSKKDPDLQYSRFAHRADPGRVRAAVDRIEGWLRLAQLENRDKRLALVLSTYPGRDYNIAHAVGLDALASCEQLLGALADQGYSVTGTGDLGARLVEERIALPLADYKAALKTLPDPLQTDLKAAWGTPEDDPDLQDGAFQLKALIAGKAIIALQPERGEVTTRVYDYHDLDRTPRHAYVAFYLWLQQ
jgi:cobaltochelatase CobN